MTYPHPSRGYQELVCTAGITEGGDWVRLYPIDYRHRPRDQKFHKYQWIEVELEDEGHGNDNRKESRRPKLDTIKVLGEPMDTKHKWKMRRGYVDALPHHTVNELKGLYDAEKTSLGVVRPSRILDLEIRPANAEWKPEWQQLFSQMTLFGPLQKELKKLPFTFHYVFECEGSEKPHKAMCEDWELGTLFLKEVDRLGSEQAAAESVRKKYFEEMCGDDKDTCFYMGTFFPYNTWLVLGVFWPPKDPQQQFFS